MIENLTLLADVGGTNTRFALADANGIRAGSSRRYANNEVGHFTEAAQDYLAGLQGERPAMLSCAIAGPVSNGYGVLTNGDWVFDSSTLPDQLQIKQAHVLNDLAALGYAVADLPADMLRQLGGGKPQGTQTLVAGIATGFNVSLCHADHVAEAELGHASLPFSVMQRLENTLGEKAHRFRTVETLFSGAGLAALHVAMGFEAASPAVITGQAGKTVQLFAQALAIFCRELSYQYMPSAGLFLNGSVARAVVEAVDDNTVIMEALEKDTGFSGRFGQMPVYLITEDSAALYGCARYARLHRA